MPCFREKCNAYRENHSRLDGRRYRLEKITLVVALLYALITFYMWRAMIGANRNATEALHITEQPYLALGDRDGKVGEFIKSDVGIPIALKLYFFNSGHEPATNVSINLFAFGPNLSSFHPVHIERSKIVGRSFPRINPPFGGSGGGITIPGNSTYTLYRTGKWMPDATWFHALDEGTSTFQPEGTIEYCDRFGVYHCAGFGAVYLGTPFHTFMIGIAESESCPTGQISDTPNPEFIHQPSGEIDRQVPIARCPQPDEQSYDYDMQP